MKILVTGSLGQLGREVLKQGKAHQCLGVDRNELDITNIKQVQECFQTWKPDAVVHCAAYTQVDRAEEEVEEAYAINAAGAQNIAAACLEANARMVHISTDYVFDGKGSEPYTEEKAVNPQSVYGKSKYLGEERVRQILGRHYILRTAWLYGEGANFVKTMLRLAQNQEPLRVVNDQFGTPTSTEDLTKAIYRLLAADAYGTYHATCQGSCSWYDFACEIFKQANVAKHVIPVSSDEFVRPAPRPAYSVMDNRMLRLTVGDPMGPWKSALSSYLRQLQG